MSDPGGLEQHFARYWTDLGSHLPDGIIEVNLELLQELNLLHIEEVEDEENDELSQSFFVVESLEKLTLFNERFAVWIVPQLVDHSPTTFTLIAKNRHSEPELEMAFSTSGVYNHSGLVLRILERFLQQIDENEAEIVPYDD